MDNTKPFFESLNNYDSFRVVQVNNQINLISGFILNDINDLSEGNNVSDDKTSIIKNQNIAENKNAINVNLLKNYNLNKIIELIKTKKNIFIVNSSFIWHKFGFNIDSIISNVQYYKNEKQSYVILYFIQERKYLQINKKNNYNCEVSINSISINNSIIYNKNSKVDYINNNNKNYYNNNKYYYYIETYNKKMNINILGILILLYANKREINRIIESNINAKYDLKKNYILVNKTWLDQFRIEFKYNDVENILSQKSFRFNTYKDYFNRLKYLLSLEEFKEFRNEIFESSPPQLQQILSIPNHNISPQISENNYPTNFELINMSLLKPLQPYLGNTKRICKYSSEFKFSFVNTILYVHPLKETSICYIYSYNKKREFILQAIFKFFGLHYFEQFNKFLKEDSFIKYIQYKKINMNKLHQIQNIFNSNNEKIGIIELNNQIIENKIETNINEEKDSIDYATNFLIFKEYQIFIKDLQNLENQNLEISNNNIDDYLSKGKINYKRVYLIRPINLEYYWNIFNFKYFDLIENTDNKNLKEKYMKEIKEPKFSEIKLIEKIVSPTNIDNEKDYSFVNENFCENITTQKDIIQSYQGLLFHNKSTILLYFQKQKTLLIVINFKDNKFKLSKINRNDPNHKDNKNYIPKENKNHIPKDYKNYIPKDNSKDENSHCLGLENIGATCYMNSTLQCLCNITSLKNYFRNKGQIEADLNNRNAPLANAFEELLNKLWEKSKDSYYSPYNFKNVISALNPLFIGVKANDSKDLIIFFYETLHNELNHPESNNTILNNLKNQDLPTELKQFRENYYSNNNSIITKIFYSEQSSNLLCCNCKCNKISFNIYNFLIFPLEKVRLYLINKKPEGFANVTLYDCFEQNEEKELLNGPNSIYCNNCHLQTNALSFNKLYNCPEVLTIILNRGKGLEFDVEFQFPMKLNISKYVLDKSCDTQYELIGVLTHLGPSGMSGHFIAYCKSPVNKKWYCYNDAQITKCIDPEIEIKSNGVPYVLYYQKTKNLILEKSMNEEYNTKNNMPFVLYFTYNEKEGYLETKENEKLSKFLKKLFSKYSLNPGENVGYYIEKNNNLLPLDISKTISENELKNENKIVIV